jgi:hypothetical protein
MERTQEGKAMKTLASFIAAAFVMTIALSPVPAAAQTEMSVTGAGGGIFPPGASYNGVPLDGLKFGFGLTIATDSSAVGHFQATLIGVSALGLTQNIEVEGKVSAGSSVAAGTATFSGASTVNMGDGAPPIPGVPFTVVVATNAQDQGTLTLTLGTTNLPGATVDEGSMKVK